MNLNVEAVLQIVNDIRTELSEVNKPPEQITFEYGSQIIPLNLFQNTRDFLLKVAVQINQTYEHSCYDACAVMIRRMLEMLIIISYEHYSIEQIIKDSAGDYMMLSGLLPKYINQNEWSLSRNTKKNLPYIKELGDFSAHKLNYNAQRGDIEKVLDKYHLRAVIEEMLYKSGLKI